MEKSTGFSAVRLTVRTFAEATSWTHSIAPDTVDSGHWPGPPPNLSDDVLTAPRPTIRGWRRGGAVRERGDGHRGRRSAVRGGLPFP